jgi:uncharacterized protein (TIGR03085 family)
MPDGTEDGPLDAVERAALCDLFIEVGPEAPTLCEGWATLDLAAHLVIREHDPRAGLAIVGGERFAGLEANLMGKAKGQGYEAIVERLRGGPPLIPWRLPGLRTPLNLNEWFVHHEDVRRANGLGPRHAMDELDAALWVLAGRTARLSTRNLKDAGLTAVAPGHGERVVKKRDPMVTLTGAPQELVLYVNGRRDVALVELTGDQAGRDALASAQLGI